MTHIFMLICRQNFWTIGEFNTVVKKSKDFWNPQNFSVSFRVSSAYLISLFLNLEWKAIRGSLRQRFFLYQRLSYPLSRQIHMRTFFFTKMDMDALCLVFFHMVNLWILSKNRHTFPGQNFLLWPVAITPWPAVLPSTEEGCVTAAIPPDWRSKWSSLTGCTGLGMITTAQSSARLWWTLMERSKK